MRLEIEHNDFCMLVSWHMTLTCMPEVKAFGSNLIHHLFTMNERVLDVEFKDSLRITKHYAAYTYLWDEKREREIWEDTGWSFRCKLLFKPPAFFSSLIHLTVIILNKWSLKMRLFWCKEESLLENVTSPSREWSLPPSSGTSSGIWPKLQIASIQREEKERDQTWHSESIQINR